MELLAISKISVEVDRLCEKEKVKCHPGRICLWASWHSLIRSCECEWEMGEVGRFLWSALHCTGLLTGSHWNLRRISVTPGERYHKGSLLGYENCSFHCVTAVYCT